MIHILFIIIIIFPFVSFADTGPYSGSNTGDEVYLDNDCYELTEFMGSNTLYNQNVPSFTEYWGQIGPIEGDYWLRFHRKTPPNKFDFENWKKKPCSISLPDPIFPAKLGSGCFEYQGKYYSDENINEEPVGQCQDGLPISSTVVDPSFYTSPTHIENRSGYLCRTSQVIHTDCSDNYNFVYLDCYAGENTVCSNDLDIDGDGYSINQGDCDDEDNQIHPGATDICGDGVDQDCSGGDLSCNDQSEVGESCSLPLQDHYAIRGSTCVYHYSRYRSSYSVMQSGMPKNPTTIVAFMTAYGYSGSFWGCRTSIDGVSDSIYQVGDIVDMSYCDPPSSCNNNGTCDPGETTENCLSDCPPSSDDPLTYQAYQSVYDKDQELANHLNTQKLESSFDVFKQTAIYQVPASLPIILDKFTGGGCQNPPLFTADVFPDRFCSEDLTIDFSKQPLSSFNNYVVPVIRWLSGILFLVLTINRIKRLF
ncbi:MAG: hypothetical protein CSB34_06115 [Desulfobulbus propionicus]|nr:MAG: hypothetical protein CSB34_06115 [Desulfobulbus propionicus]